MEYLTFMGMGMGMREGECLIVISANGVNKGIKIHMTYNSIRYCSLISIYDKYRRFVQTLMQKEQE